MSFNQGLNGVASGSAMNSAGLMFHSISQIEQGKEQRQEDLVLCKINEVQWHSEGDCFIPTQFHINIASCSILLNVILITVILSGIYLSKRSTKEKYHV